MRWELTFRIPQFNFEVNFDPCMKNRPSNTEYRWHYYVTTGLLCSCISVLCVVGFLPRVTKCTTDSSWFVKKAAVDLIAKILLSSISNTMTPAACNGVLSDEEKKMVTAVFAPIMTDEVCDVNRLSICLEILENRELSVSIFSLLCLDKRQIVEKLCSLLRYLPASVSCDSATRILEILASVCESSGYWSESKQELLPLVTVLLNGGKLLLAVTVAVWLLQRFVVMWGYTTVYYTLCCILVVCLFLFHTHSFLVFVLVNVDNHDVVFNVIVSFYI